MTDFLLIGNKNCIAHKDFFKLMMDRRVNIGYTRPGDFDQPDGTPLKTLQGLTRWFTTLSVDDKPALTLTATYTPEKYPHYDNYPAIEVGRIKDIPTDYTEEMGVPITIFDYDLDGFVILGIAADKYGDEEWMIKGNPIYRYKHPPFVGMELKGKHKYARVLIKTSSSRRSKINDTPPQGINKK